MEISSQKTRIKIYNQIEEEYGKVTYTYTTQIIYAKRLKRKNNFFKWVHIILSAISSGSFLGTIITNKTVCLWLGGICSLILLVISSYFKESQLAENFQNHLVTSNSLWIVKEKYISLLADYDNLSLEEIINRRDILQNQTLEIYNTAPLTDDRSYKLAQKALKNEESQYFTRKELNQILPAELRK